MQAAVLHRYNSPLEILERPDPEPPPGWILVDVRGCGVCGSDVFLRKGGFNSVLPIVPGHEASGVVREIGEGVDPSVAPPGTPVALYYIDHCGTCRMCSIGRVNMCLSVRRMGVEYDGAFASQVLVPERNVIPVLPSDDPAAVAVLTDAVATPYHGLVRIGKVQPGETVVVFGVGGIGSNAVQLAAYLGCTVIAVSRSDAKLELAERLGAHHVVRGGDGAPERVRALCGPGGPEVVVQTVGSAVVDRQAIDTSGIGSRVIMIGTTIEGFELRATDLVWRESSVWGSRGFTPADIREVLELHRAGAVTTDHLLVHRRPLTEVNEALADLQAGRVLRSVLTFGEGW